MVFTSFIRFVAWRFQQSKQQDGYISFVSSSSTFGVGLGCAALILLLSVMNGFERELRDNLLSIVPHAELINASPSGITPNANYLERMRKDAKIAHVFALNKASGLLQKGKQIKSIELIGVDKDYHQHKLSAYFDYQILSNTSNSIVLGKGIMQALSLNIGDSVQVLLPKVTEDLSFQTSVATWLTVVGEVNIGGEIDSFIGITNHVTLASMLNLDDAVTHLELQMHDPFDAYEIVRKYGWDFNQAVYMSDWTRTHGHLYQDIKLVRTVIYIVLVLVICVASFNIVSSLVMSVREKSREIAILKTMGASQSQIKRIFITKGLYSGLFGATLGSIIGCVLGAYLPQIIDFIEDVLSVELLDAGVYFTSSIPSELMLTDVAITYSLAVVISVLATLYPSAKAGAVLPGEHLH
ncbi:FtsX-like permease family protein [Glaciecola siphonariae]|uniref:FtsX-like permease family protein n=1 Tax=Glaciecola siphonariae TaxID=521012 RepID=A0ABV9LTF8_9ALTE